MDVTSSVPTFEVNIDQTNLCLFMFFDVFCIFLVPGIPVKSTLDNSTTVQYAGLMSQLSDKARSVVRDLDPGNDLTFLRVRSKKHEIMVAPDKDFILIVIQNPSDWAEKVFLFFF